MKNISFNIDKGELLGRIYTNTFYRGERLKDGGSNAARMQAYTDDEAILRDEMMAAANDVAAMIYRVFNNCSVEDRMDSIVLAISETQSEKTLVWKAEDKLWWDEEGELYCYTNDKIAVGENPEFYEDGGDGSILWQKPEVVSVTDCIAFDVAVSSNFPNDYTALKDCIEGYLCCRMLEEWLSVTNPAEINNLVTRSAAKAEMLMNLLLKRDKPAR